MSSQLKMIEDKLIKEALGRMPRGKERQDITTTIAPNGDFVVQDRGAVIGRLKKGTFQFINSTHFENGCKKAQAEIQNKLGNRFGNIAMGITSFDIEQLEKEIKKKGFSAVKERLNTGYMKASVGDNYDIKQLYEKQLNILDKIQSRMNNIR